MSTAPETLTSNSPSGDLALVIRADQERYGHPYGDMALQAFYARGGREELALAGEYCRSSDPLDQLAGATMLEMFGKPEFAPVPEAPNPFPKESTDFLLPLLTSETPRVIVAAMYALLLCKDSRIAPALMKMDQHPAWEVREAMVVALSQQDDPESIACMVQLTESEDEYTQKKAIERLLLGEFDSPDVRQKLYSYLDDDDLDIRIEALEGIARRNDPRIVSELLKFWETSGPDDTTFDIAEELADSRLVPGLKKLLAELAPGVRAAWKERREDWTERQESYQESIAEVLEVCEG